MTDWSTFRHAYGDASDVPALLDGLSPDPNDDSWGEVWSRLCHQGTVYSASFAALPRLLELTATWEASRRPMILALAGAIVASQDVKANADQRQSAIAAMAAPFEQLALETLAWPGLPTTDFVYVAEAALAFRGDVVWGDQLDGLNSGEFEGICPVCDAEVMLVVGEYGFFATSEEWVNRASTKRVPILQTSIDSLPDVGRWLYGQAEASHQRLLMEWLLYLFGSTKCPSCGAGIRVSESVERACRPRSADGPT